MENGAVISVADFIDIASPKTVSKTLTRLSDSGVISRVMRSIFWKPDASKKGPAPDDVAEALARENGWETAPSKETALVLFNLEDEMPSVFTYVTNGTNRTYRYGEHTITFTHVGEKALDMMTKKTRMLVQCIKAYGKERLSEDRIRKLADKIHGWDFHSLKEETKNVARWVRVVVGRLCSVAKAKQEDRA